MEEIIVLFFQLLVEILQIFGSVPIDAARSRSSRKDDEGCLVIVMHVIFGGGLGLLSVLFAPKFLLPTMALRIANLFIAPVISGAISYYVIGKISNNKTQGVFIHGVLFAFMFGLARLLAVKG